jgi:hypothetical protein
MIFAPSSAMWINTPPVAIYPTATSGLMQPPPPRLPVVVYPRQVVPKPFLGFPKSKAAGPMAQQPMARPVGIILPLPARHRPASCLRGIILPRGALSLLPQPRPVGLVRRPTPPSKPPPERLLKQPPPERLLTQPPPKMRKL